MIPAEILNEDVDRACCEVMTHLKRLGDLWSFFSPSGDWKSLPQPLWTWITQDLDNLVFVGKSSHALVVLWRIRCRIPWPDKLVAYWMSNADLKIVLRYYETRHNPCRLWITGIEFCSRCRPDSNRAWPGQFGGHGKIEPWPSSLLENPF